METTIKLYIDQKKEINVKTISSKPFDELTQEDLIYLRSVVENGLRFEADKDTEGTYNAAFSALRLLSNYELFRPMDQRSLHEYVRDIIVYSIDQLSEEHLILNVTQETIQDVLDTYIMGEHIANGTVTYNTQQTLNLIRSFWSDFLEGDLESWNADDVFTKPENFLLDQVSRMAYRILDNLLAPKDQDVSLTLGKLKEKLEGLCSQDLSDMVY